MWSVQLRDGMVPLPNKPMRTEVDDHGNLWLYSKKGHVLHVFAAGDWRHLDTQ